MSRIVADVPLSEIVRGDNDRTVFDDHAIARLAKSMDTYGLAQPVTLRPHDGGYQIVAGERRVRAARTLDWTTIPAIVRDLDDDDASAVMLTENTARVDLDPVDEAMSYQSRLDAGWDQQRVAEAAGVHPARVSARLGLLELVPEAQALVRCGQLTPGWCTRLRLLTRDRQQAAVRALNRQPMAFAEWNTLLGNMIEAQRDEPMFDADAFFVAEAVAEAKEQTVAWCKADVIDVLAAVVDAHDNGGDMDKAMRRARAVVDAERQRG